METNIELGEGQSFVIAGLIDNRVTETISRIPGLASLPILGNLFKSKQTDRNNTELVVMVTPEITMPLQPGEAKPMPPMPRDFLPPATPNAAEPYPIPGEDEVGASEDCQEWRGEHPMTRRGPVLTALAIVPDRELASQFASAIERTRSFQILSEFKPIRPHQALEMRLRQVQARCRFAGFGDRSGPGLRTDSLDGSHSIIQTQIVGLHVTQRFRRHPALAADGRQRISVRAV